LDLNRVLASTSVLFPMSTEQGTTLLMCMVLAGIMYVPLLIMEHSAGLYFTTFQMLNIGKLSPFFFFLESPRIFWNDIEEGRVG